MPLADNVARNLHSAREAKKLSQVVLAKKAKISVSYVSMLEKIDPGDGGMDGVLCQVSYLMGHLDAEPAFHLKDHVGEGLGP